MLIRLASKWFEARAASIEDRYPPNSLGAEMRRLARNLHKLAGDLR